MPVEVKTQRQHSPFVSFLTPGQNHQRNQLWCPDGRAHSRSAEWGNISERNPGTLIFQTFLHFVPLEKHLPWPCNSEVQVHDCHHAGSVLCKTYSLENLQKYRLLMDFLSISLLGAQEKNVSSYCFGNHGASGGWSRLWKIWGFQEIRVKCLMGSWTGKTSKVKYMPLILEDRNEQKGL